MTKEINHLTLGMAVSGKNVLKKIFFNTNSACLAQAMAWPFAKKWHYVIFT